MSAAAETGYIGARRLFDEREQIHVTSKRRWRAFAFLLAAGMVLALGIIAGLLSAQKHRDVYVVATDKLGHTVASGYANQRGATVDDEKNMLQEFVEKWRFVSSDWPIQKQAIERAVYPFLEEGNASAKMDEWYRGHQPLVRARTNVITVEECNVLPMGGHAFEAEWYEQAWLSGTKQGRTHWKAWFRLAQVKRGIGRDDDEAIDRNPFGLVIAEWHESAVMDGGK
jgi:type IV secretory pathway TrbF-like protein